MNTSLSTFMKIFLTAVVIGTLVFGLYYTSLEDITNDVNNYIERNNAN